MKRIKEITIKNFKAFQEEQSLRLDGKNILVYGSNGSGKSSVFWALYTILQSSIKADVDIQKYFKKFEESDTGTHQTLKNVFVDPSEDAYIKITTIDTETKHEQIHTISHDTINTNQDTDTLIQELNLASDFINYKLLNNFYRGSHKQEVNLWPVFERDIFPFLTEGTQNWLSDIIIPLTKDVPRTPRGKVVSQNRKAHYISKLNELNDKIEQLLSDIETNANVFLKNHFFEGRDVIRIQLSFQKKFRFELVRQKIWRDMASYHRKEHLKISLQAEVFENGDWINIRRIQSFLNEAQLTRIAIGIRIGALRTRVQSTQYKILVLDDMLISLDMSNRMDVVRIILNKENKESLKYFDDFQKIILTHDKAFFNLIQRNTADEDWSYYKFNKDQDKNEAPKIKEDESHLQKAIKYFEVDEFDSCGNELRKEAEKVLTQYLDPQMKALDKDFSSLTDKINTSYKKILANEFQNFKNIYRTDLEPNIIEKLKTDFENDGTLSDAEKGKLRTLRNRMVTNIIKVKNHEAVKLDLLNQTKEILDRVLNPASHSGANPLFRSELREAIELVKQLRLHLNP